jgi:aryl-alcohol dehydrogenase-like predicted oxidoreductase
MVSRREWLGTSLGAAAALALTPDLLRALQRASALQPGGKLIQRAIPSSGEMVPAVGLSFSNHPGCADHAALTEVLRMFYDNGGRVYDAMHVNPTTEQFHIDAATALGIQDKLFWSTRGTPGNAAPDPELVKPHIASLLARIKAPKIDLVMLPAAADPKTLAALQEEKKAGRVRYIGVQVIVDDLFPKVETIMRNEPIDFIGINYDVGSRKAEEVLLPLALQRKIGVMAFFPFNNAQGLSCTGSTSLFDRTRDKPLPEWAADFDAKTWAQFFVKYVISHPAITVVRVGTTKPAHMIDDISGGMGRLPDEATRKRMAALIDALPPAPQRGRGGPPPGPTVALPAAILDRYVGDWKTPGGGTITLRRDGTTLFVKPGNAPEAPLIARSETRFQDPRGPVFEFQVDAQGRATGAILEQQGPQGIQRIPLERK